MLILICCAVHKLREVPLIKYQVVYSIKESYFDDRIKNPKQYAPFCY